MYLRLIAQLNSGHSIPVLALGVYQARSEECYSAVLTALEAGYRHIDSAAWYGNEADVGRAVSKWMKTTGGKREEVTPLLLPS
jgi:diketogulonate reductase-like aldo/keto reductase